MTGIQTFLNGYFFSIIFFKDSKFYKTFPLPKAPDKFSSIKSLNGRVISNAKTNRIFSVRTFSD